MERASDRAGGQLIHAESPQARRGGLVCPCCKAPVNLRRGFYRAAYFAHKSGRADPECELYHSIPDYAHITRVFAGETSGQIDAGGEHIPSQGEPELFLEVSPALRARLFLLVPKTPESPTWSGTIRLSTSRGERQFKQHQLTVDEYVEVEAHGQDYSLEVLGDVADDYRSVLSHGVRGLDREINLFRASQSKSRRLGPSDVLRWGDTLWLLIGTEDAFQKLTSSKFAKTLNSRELEFHRDWRAVEVDLPDEADLPSEAKSAFSELFQREIKSALPDLLLLQPLPHHFSQSGEWVIPSGTTRILLYRSKPIPVSVESIQGNQSLVVEDVSDDVVEIRNISDGAFRVWAGQVKAIDIRAESCEFRSTRTASISISGEYHSLTRLRNDKGLRIRAREEYSSVALELMEETISSITKLQGSPWPGNEIFRKYLADTKTSVRLEIDNVVTVDFEDLEKYREAGMSHVGTKRGQGTEAMFITNLAQAVRGPTMFVSLNRKAPENRSLMRLSSAVPLAIVPYLRRLVRSRGE